MQPRRSFWSAELKRLLAPLIAALALVSCAGLPDTSGREQSFARKDTADTRLAHLARQFTAGHPGDTGVHALAKGPDALAARLALADLSGKSLDVQYYIWHSDASGVLLVTKLLQAADRGVKVRMLLDDLGTMASDEGLQVLESHPNIEVRLFNPVTLRSSRMLGALLDFQRANRRMHNKTFIADNQAAIVGGRNIGDEYFGAHGDMNFADLDVIAVGPVVHEVSRQFDAYWNSTSSIGIGAISTKRVTPEQLAARRTAFEDKHVQAQSSPALVAVARNPLVSRLKNGNLPFLPAHAWAVYDDPEKVTSAAGDRSTHLAPKLRSVIDGTQSTLFVVSPYFIPEKQGVELFRSLRSRGVRVIILTNSLASTDVAAVHAGYKRYRKSLLRSGVEIYELKPGAAPRAGGTGGSSPFRGSSRASLHAKTFTFDERTTFIGSMNLDPRSLRLNTEVGVLIDCPPLASELTRKSLQGLSRQAYKVQLEGDKLVWLSIEDGDEIRYTTEPETSAWQRMKVTLLGCLPIEGQL
ncbi:putative cardiolipin synthase [Roseimicrobium gellanilyticum]|uniref:Putative cardiolipin synthase n=1 Tax=Roseimicrobium gellanilyticum TaxID=748857 RepID=A0A366HA89_9BACT|nr:phospholipase D family protein [Roseimicrobium gellanilyticum]RBP38067.1 putative cardiolipin synthase [Roseimicrobium gellanilyticum]